MDRFFAILSTSLITATALMGDPFFTFDNGLGKKTPTEQAAQLKQLGYDGIGYKGLRRPAMLPGARRAGGSPETLLRQMTRNSRAIGGAGQAIDRLPSGGESPTFVPCQS